MSYYANGPEYALQNDMTIKCWFIPVNAAKIDLLMQPIFVHIRSLSFSFQTLQMQHSHHRNKSHYFSSSPKEPARYQSTKRESNSLIGDWLAREEALLNSMEADITERVPSAMTKEPIQVCKDMCPVFHLFAVLLTWHLVCSSNILRMLAIQVCLHGIIPPHVFQ